MAEGAKDVSPAGPRLGGTPRLGLRQPDRKAARPVFKISEGDSVMGHIRLQRGV